MTAGGDGRGQHVVLKKRFWHFTWPAWLVVAGMTAGFIWGRLDSLWQELAAALSAGALLGYTVLIATFARITIADDVVLVRTDHGRTKRIPRDEIVELSLGWGGWRFRLSSGKLVRLPTYWTHADIRRLAAALNVPTSPPLPRPDGQ
jgi:hypothetical protein